MRIAFVEVRDKTELLLRVATELHEHQVFWLVQNAAFARPAMTNRTILPYPSARALRRPSGAAAAPLAPEHRRLLERVAAGDRFQTTFRGNTAHYAYYFALISAWFERIRPELIIGEIGNFHSHIVALLAEQQGVPFLTPSSTRYPGGRFSFYLNDRLRTVGGDDSDYSDEALAADLAAISGARTAPDYMRPRRRRAIGAAYRMRLLAEWVRGERFATQHPFHFLDDARRRRAVLAGVETAARSAGSREADRAARRRPSVLYPLQMQPELNLDLWGREHRDQTALIRRLSTSNIDVIVKPNPKPFHELSPALLKLGDQPNIRFLGLSTPMSDAEAAADLVVTVTGTIAIERLLRRRPVLILSQDYADWLGVGSAADLGIHPDSLDAESAARVAEAQSELAPADLLRRLAAQSYHGRIGEPLAFPEVLDRVNVLQIATAVRHLIAGGLDVRH